MSDIVYLTLLTDYMTNGSFTLTNTKPDKVDDGP